MIEDALANAVEVFNVLDSLARLCKALSRTVSSKQFLHSLSEPCMPLVKHMASPSITTETRMTQAVLGLVGQPALHQTV